MVFLFAFIFNLVVFANWNSYWKWKENV